MDLNNLHILQAFGFNKPQTVDRVSQTTVDPYTDLNYSAGVSHSNMFSTDPENSISTDNRIFPSNNDDMLLSTIAGTPSLSNKLQYNSSLLPPQILCHLRDLPPINDVSYVDIPRTFVDHLAQNFQCTTGSYKIMCYFASNPSIKSRGVIYLTNTLSTDFAWETAYHQVVDIQGDTIVNMTIPYLDAQFYQQQNDSVFLAFRPLSYSAPFDVSPFIHINVFKAAASDFRFFGLVETNYKLKMETVISMCNVREHFTKDFAYLHPSMKTYIPSKIGFGEEYKTLRDIIHKDYFYGETIAPGNDQTIPAFAQCMPGNQFTDFPGTYTYVAQGLEYWGLFYKFFRGSVRLRVVAPQNPNDTFAGQMYSYGSQPFYCISSEVNPQLSVTLPYRSQFPYFKTFMTVDQPGGVYSLGFTSYNCPTSETNPKVGMRGYFKAGGDDFSFHLLRLPPRGYYITPVGSLSFANLYAFD